MAKVAVITGGGSGMGLEAAKILGQDRIVVLAGRTVSKLEGAVEELKKLGVEAYAHAADTSKRENVRELAEYAASLGDVTNVINSAGLSPAMSDAETILRVNALGTVYINQEFSKVMGKGTAIVDVASNSAYALPSLLIPKSAYKLAESDEEAFIAKILKRASLAKGDYQRSGMAYAISKNFVVWYAKKSAFDLGKKGIRVCSLSPGLIATDMGNLEAGEAQNLIRAAAEERMGDPAELGYALASIADERNGYLAAVDVLVDGGSTTGGKEFGRK